MRQDRGTDSWQNTYWQHKHATLISFSVLHGISDDTGDFFSLLNFKNSDAVQASLRFSKNRGSSYLHAPPAVPCGSPVEAADSASAVSGSYSVAVATQGERRLLCVTEWRRRWRRALPETARPVCKHEP